MLFLQPLFTDRRIGKHFRWYRNLWAKPVANQRSEHLECFLWCKVHSQIDIRRQSSISMQQSGNSTDDYVPHTRCIQDFEYGLVD